VAISSSNLATVALTGPVTLRTLPEVRSALAGISPGCTLDLGGITHLDTAGAWLIVTTLAGPQGGQMITGATTAQTRLIDAVKNALPEHRKIRKPRLHHRAGDLLLPLGRGVSGLAGVFAGALESLGAVTAAFCNAIIHPSRLRVTALVHHMQDAGLNAIPIVALMGFLIGIVLAFQGATQLAQFGAEVFVVDLIAISILRELGILLTAIIVAGRSASAFTAAIGSMKMREEIDAMRTLGLDPVEVLILPRVLALVIFLPILGFVADLSGLFGGALMAWINLGISPELFRTQLLANTDVSHALVGLSKAPVFALIIGIVGCHQGMQVAGNAESLGQRTSRSVVIAIFLVIVVDALFSIFFALWGV
jgi:phospholipid/cholesterol/gamma-HCH transport system permease protein